jgi:ferritin-like metal-binding protein YciE
LARRTKKFVQFAGIKQTFCSTLARKWQMATNIHSHVRPIYITGLRNAHSLEKEAINIIDRQLDRIENFPEVSDRLRLHRDETEGQILRLEQLLGDMNESPSGLKDAALSIMGNVAALSHTVADDEILKNAFANCALENFEIASYTSLIAMAHACGSQGDITALEASLREERAMAQWCEESIEKITLQYLALHRSPASSNH